MNLRMAITKTIDIILFPKTFSNDSFISSLKRGGNDWK